MVRAPRGALVGTVLSGVALALVAPSPAEAAVVDSSPRTAAPRPAVVERVVIGHSRKGREILAFRLGDPDAKRSAVVIAAMHGDERKPQAILRNLRDGAPITGLDLWVIPSANPDGVARKARRNARGVDLNRNFPRRWKRSKRGPTWSGPSAASEPETKAMMRFLRKVQPDQVVSFHQPLYGIDTSGTGNRPLARRLAKHLRLPKRTFSCGSGCHGTMSQWFNHRLDGQLVTVELGRRPTKAYLTRTAPRGLLKALGGRRPVPSTI
ncbi:murein peptide amidase A [Mumia zhuanghuii]|uniref:M14 family zinc carboxypeptidase n=2 Tax=Mumia TaxID=1546255 RepID=A0ABW1QGR8_9ACTN|nr:MULTISPECIES: M14 family zinc carboxypeptidase [Mumia]KAA1422671.1 murein peptide amidase A [Mumia zhuanghuii]